MICIQKTKIARRDLDISELLEEKAQLEKKSQELENTALGYAQKYHQLQQVVDQYSKANNIYGAIAGNTNCNWTGPHFGHGGGEGPIS